MNGRSYVLILFFWALLTVITPTLIRMSASAKLLDINGVEAKGLNNRLFPRRALVATRFIASPAPEPSAESDYWDKTYVQQKLEIIKLVL